MQAAAAGRDPTPGHAWPMMAVRVIAVGLEVAFVLTGPGLRRLPVAWQVVALTALAVAVAAFLLVDQPGPVPQAPTALSRASAVALVVAGAVMCVLLRDGTGQVVAVVAALNVARADLPRWVEWTAVGVCVAALWGFNVRVGARWWAYPAWLAGVVAAYQLGMRRRDARERLEQAELMLAKEQALAAEHARVAAAEERGRIARELHDVLAHTLSGLSISLQATGLLLERQGASQEAQGRVAAARALAIDGLGEARAAVAALGTSRRDGPPDLVAALDRQVRDHRAITGVQVRLDVRGAPGVVSPAVADAVAGVVREALTNTVRHAPGAPVVVEVDAARGTLTVRVVDDVGGPSAPAGSGGAGLAGMVRRAAEVGGTVTSGPVERGWAVELSVPIEASQLTNAFPPADAPAPTEPPAP